MGALVSGSYLIKVHTDGFLMRDIFSIVTVISGEAITLPSVSLVTGDVNNDNILDIADYNYLLSCFGTKFTTSSCLSLESDVNDDGAVDGADYNLFLRELSVQVGG